VIAAVGLLVTLNSGALARVGDTWRAIGDAPAVATAAPTSVAVVTRAPTVAPSIVPTPAPETAQPTPTPSEEPTDTPTQAPTQRPATPTPKPVVQAPAPKNASADAAAATIARFYQLVSADRLDEAAALWSARMRAAYPPATNIYGRFSSTRSIALTGWSVASQGPSGATINVNIVEVMKDGTSRRWVGQWLVVSSGDAWFMDQPALARA
jgi:hypothetical protein